MSKGQGLRPRCGLVAAHLIPKTLLQALLKLLGKGLGPRSLLGQIWACGDKNQGERERWLEAWIPGAFLSRLRRASRSWELGEECSVEPRPPSQSLKRDCYHLLVFLNRHLRWDNFS